jgi:hypothetical protein
MKKGVGSGSGCINQRYGSPTLLESRIPVYFHADLCWGSPEHESPSLCFVQPFKVTAGSQLLTQQSENIKGKTSYFCSFLASDHISENAKSIEKYTFDQKMRQKVKRSLFKMGFTMSGKPNY